MVKRFCACSLERNVLHHHQKCLRAQLMIKNSIIKASGAISGYDKTHTQSTTQTGCHGNACDIIMTPLPADSKLRCVASPPCEHPWILYHPLYKSATHTPQTQIHALCFCQRSLVHTSYACQLRFRLKQSTSWCLAKIHLGF